MAFWEAVRGVSEVFGRKTNSLEIRDGFRFGADKAGASSRTPHGWRFEGGWVCGTGESASTFGNVLRVFTLLGVFEMGCGTL